MALGETKGISDDLSSLVKKRGTNSVFFLTKDLQYQSMKIFHWLKV